MKKQIMQKAAAVLMLVALVCSCEREKEIVDMLDRGGIALVMDKVTTRVDVGSRARVYGYSVGKTEDGYALTLEEVVTEMDCIVDDIPETRGTPAYTQNVTSVYGNSFNGVLYASTGQTEIVGDDAFTVMSGVTGKDGKAVWRREIGFNPWTQSDPLYFFLRMPANPAGVTGLEYNKSGNTVTPGVLQFDYETPSTAATQQDILFASRELTETAYLNETKNNGGAAVLFRHALTGVKFAIGNNNTLTDGARHPSGVVETFITEVSIRGLKNKGHAVFNPTGSENASQVDNPDEHTSAGSFTWTDLSGTNRTTVYTQTYGENDIVDFSKDDAVGAPDSFYDAGAGRNLNKADASLTFWFIPQAITSDLVVTVKFKIWDGQSLGAEQELPLNLGALILAQEDKPGYTNKTWSAGQLRTFSLKPNMVDVDITDDVEGFTKDNVVIRNTGNVKAFLRAHIVANWFGETEAGVDGIALGYDGQSSSTFVKAWQIETVSGTTVTDNYGGVFTGLPGSSGGSGDGDGGRWVRATDGFFYYTVAVDPGQATTAALFSSYNLDTTQHPVPEIWYLDSTRKQFDNVRLVMEIPVQAIMAKENYTYQQGWQEAGVTVTVATL